jgi:hypothetical protein
METTQGNSLCSLLYLKLAKNIMFLFLSFMFMGFFFCKIGEQEGRTGSAQEKWGLTPVGWGRWQGKG